MRTIDVEIPCILPFCGGHIHCEVNFSENPRTPRGQSMELTFYCEACRFQYHRYPPRRPDVVGMLRSRHSRIYNSTVPMLILSEVEADDPTEFPDAVG